MSPQRKAAILGDAAASPLTPDATFCITECAVANSTPLLMKLLKRARDLSVAARSSRRVGGSVTVFGGGCAVRSGTSREAATSPGRVVMGTCRRNSKGQHATPPHTLETYSARDATRDTTLMRMRQVQRPLTHAYASNPLDAHRSPPPRAARCGALLAKGLLRFRVVDPHLGHLALLCLPRRPNSLFARSSSLTYNAARERSFKSRTTRPRWRAEVLEDELLD